MKDEIKRALDFDSLAEAEKITGKSYKDDDATSALGFELLQESSARKEQLIDSTGDTKFFEKTGDYMDKVVGFGFSVVLDIPFTSDGINENLYVMWHDEHSILLVWDTFRGDRNGGKFYYNWSPNYRHDTDGCTSSGGFVRHDRRNHTYGHLFNGDYTPHILSEEIRSKEPSFDWDNYDEYRESFDEWCEMVRGYSKEKKLITIWSGDHDCREALKYHINTMTKKGVFLKEWKEQPFLWLLHHGDTKGEYDYKAINKERIAMLPERVRKAIGVLQHKK